jgi:CPA2 family monovalent cation:H+ antiporter-2
VEAREPKRFREIVAFYHQWLAELHGRSNASLLWQLCSKRILYTAMQLFFVSAALLFSKPLLGLLVKLLGRDPQASGGLAFLFWIALGIVLLAPIIAIWRNTEALVMIIADGATRHSSKSELLRPPLQAALKAVGGIVLLAWFLLMIPFGLWIFWAFCLVAGVVLFFAPVFWRRLVSLHSRLELDFREKMRAASVVSSTSGLPVSVLERPQEWDLQIDEVTLPFRTEHAGRCIADLGIRQRLGCSIMAIDRQGTLLTNPTATEKLFANDKLLLLGTAEQLAAAEQFLRGSGSSAGLNEFDDITMETLEVAEQNPDLGKSLAELDLVGRFGVQICGIQRGSQRILVPSSAEQLLAGDKLLLLGTHEKIQNFRTHLHAPLPGLPPAGPLLP